MGGGPSRRGRGGGRGGRGLARQNSANRKHRVRKERKPSVIVILSADRTAAPRRARTVTVSKYSALVLLGSFCLKLWLCSGYFDAITVPRKP